MLKISQFGDPILRHEATELGKDDILAEETQTLISNMRKLLLDKKLGIGLAAPQVGIAKRLAIVAIRPK